MPVKMLNVHINWGIFLFNWPHTSNTFDNAEGRTFKKTYSQKSHSFILFRWTHFCCRSLFFCKFHHVTCTLCVFVSRIPSSAKQPVLQPLPLPRALGPSGALPTPSLWLAQRSAVVTIHIPADKGLVLVYISPVILWWWVEVCQAFNSVRRPVICCATEPTLGNIQLKVTKVSQYHYGSMTISNDRSLTSAPSVHVILCAQLTLTDLELEQKLRTQQIAQVMSLLV